MWKPIGTKCPRALSVTQHRSLRCLHKGNLPFTTFLLLFNSTRLSLFLFFFPFFFFWVLFSAKDEKRDGIKTTLWPEHWKTQKYILSRWFLYILYLHRKDYKRMGLHQTQYLTVGEKLRPSKTRIKCSASMTWEQETQWQAWRTVPLILLR